MKRKTLELTIFTRRNRKGEKGKVDCASVKCRPYKYDSTEVNAGISRHSTVG
jgi:hypothetical protein